LIFFVPLQAMSFLSFGGSPVGNGSKTPNGVKSQGLFRASRRILGLELDPMIPWMWLVMIVLVIENPIRDPVGEGGTRSIPLVVRAFFTQRPTVEYFPDKVIL
jgi:hypothetical protein